MWRFSFFLFAFLTINSPLALVSRFLFCLFAVLQENTKIKKIAIGNKKIRKIKAAAGH